MTRSRSRQFWPAISLIAGLCVWPFSASSLSASVPEADAIDALVRQARSIWNVPGVAVAVVTRDRTVYLGTDGVRELGRPEPVTPDTLFPLSSCSKAFTTTLLAMLADERRLNWDDPVRRHLPDFRLADPTADADVRLRDLLTHRTGVGSYDILWYRSPLSPAEQVRRLRFLPGDYPFRSGFAYQSVMFTAAGLSAERAGGRPWSEQIRRRLTEPLGMAATIPTSPTAAMNRAMPHRDGPIDWYEQPEPNAAGSLHAPIRDLVPWLQFQLGDGSWNGRRLVSAENFAETHAPHVALRLDGLTAAEHPDTRLMSYALGWVVQDYRGELLRSHAGLIDGFRAHLAIAPRPGVAIAVLANRHATRMNLALVNTLLDRLLNLPPRDWHGYLLEVTRRARDLDEAARSRFNEQRGPMSRPLAEYAGEYNHPAIGTIELELQAGRLWAKLGRDRIALTPHRGDTFRGESAEYGWPIFEFEFSAAGQVTATGFGLKFMRR